MVKEKAEIKKGNILKILSLERKFSTPILVKKIQNRFIFYFHNDPLSMKGSKTIDERLFILCRSAADIPLLQIGIFSKHCSAS